ncbi:MAG TPA: phosphoribosylaminoimidazolesuccinocarboxamide synthase [Nitrosomonas nitrosa]|uniref:Phosphoribosylaminoimidazole-succinocarboxamide synthase n=1 Tax=Nitrosomonas nitrosa TaxID=52442 RepID=A0A8H8YZJ0_9PROT|nr:phosphoribosylaminoimidazolesuccinocarboxamide synthase [Nitrosomonas nitrosa]PTQ98813.1 phosphoribosylaminoimidazole-succinocarboxamide synthase [Nitrosomonas nitrosa]CAE6492985.1 Phosphoribosylaminoimidazole-succinocarboxamide synthase [Nitrosomonas nitrosa]HBZ30665.1 phosphoribosylaminoimidazolesuccinocarboxamide synthase [Nitrosomonas nitrosa]HNP50830.1 phosphoribosylaminoimidazolesuccinocarboxamide synthase [Nitrosomonas nitrosa]
MNDSIPLFETNLTSLPLLHRGKVRDIYAVDEHHLLVIQTDRLSAFDVILPTPVPGKGKVLTRLSHFWFEKLSHILPNHLTGIAPESIVTPEEREQVIDRAFVVKRLRPLPIEAIVRGYIVGSGWKDYQRTGAVSGIALPPGLQEADKLPMGAVFTPSTKAMAGAHDENITFEECERLLGVALAQAVRSNSIALYSEAADYAATRGVIIADTKFEFGQDTAGQLYLIDEVLTPDSSRFWPADQYRPGKNPPSYDKQFVRDWLEQLNWNKQPPAPAIPDEILAQTVARYQEALDRLLH